MADYGYRNAEEFYRDFYHNKGRTLKERRPLPPPGAALTSGALEGGSPDERRAIEQGISDEDLAADLQKADIGRSWDSLDTLTDIPLHLWRADPPRRW